MSNAFVLKGGNFGHFRAKLVGMTTNARRVDDGKLKTMLKTAFLIAALAVSALGCGVPQNITGRVWNPLFARSIVTLELAGLPIAVRSTSTFGYFRFNEMAPCNIYRLTVKNKAFSYEPVTFTLPGNEGVDLFLTPILNQGGKYGRSRA